MVEDVEPLSWNKRRKKYWILTKGKYVLGMHGEWRCFKRIYELDSRHDYYIFIDKQIGK